MGVMVWVLGHARAIPVNYMSLELNEALINWLSPGSTYDDVVNEAANQAGGQGFVTEMAGDAAPMADVIVPSWETSEWDLLRTETWGGRHTELVSRALSTFGSHDGIRDVVTATVPVPAGYTLEEVLGCFTCVYGWGPAEIPGFDPAAFLAALESSVIEPMTRTAELFRTHATMTRFYTTMSADEMTRDPMFAFNSNLDDVSSVHNATRVIECSPSLSQSEAPWRVVLPSGETVRGTGTSWPFTAAGGEMPANARIRRLDTEGEGEVIVDNVAAITATLATHNRTIRRPSVMPGGGGGCSVGRGHTGAVHGAPIALALFGIVGLALRARRSRAA
jgi:hypothetical protein